MDTSQNGFGFSRQEADHVMKEIQNMDVKTASEFLESQYGYYNAIYAYEDLEIHKGTCHRRLPALHVQLPVRRPRLGQPE